MIWSLWIQKDDEVVDFGKERSNSDGEQKQASKKQYNIAATVVVVLSSAPSSPTITKDGLYGRPFEGCDGQGARVHMLVFVVDSTALRHTTGSSSSLEEAPTFPLLLKRPHAFWTRSSYASHYYRGVECR